MTAPHALTLALLVGAIAACLIAVSILSRALSDALEAMALSNRALNRTPPLGQTFTETQIYTIGWNAAVSAMKKLADNGELAVRSDAIVALAPEWFVETAGMMAEMAEMERQRGAL